MDVFFPVMDIRFISVNDIIDSFMLPSSMNNISVSFKNVMNEEYCRDISHKIRSTFVAKFENGEYLCGFALYGYERDPVNRGKLLVDPEAGEVIKQIFSMVCGRQNLSVDNIQIKPIGYSESVEI